MSGPWEDFAPQGKAEAGPWDDFKAKAAPSQESVLGGVGTALADIVGGIPGMIAGPVAGVIKGVQSGSAKQGLDKAKEVMEDMTPSVYAERKGFDVPKDNKGYEYTMKPFELMSEGISKAAQGWGKVARDFGADPEETSAMMELSVLGGLGAEGVRGAKKLKDKAKGKEVDASLDKLKGKEVPVEPQIDLFEAIKRAEAENAAQAPTSSLYDAQGALKAKEGQRGSLSNKRQMELDFGEREVPVKFDKEGNPVREAGTTTDQLPSQFNVEPDGTVFRGKADDLAYEEALRKEAEARGELPEQRALQQGDVFEPINPYDVGGHVSKLREGGITALDTPQGELFGATVRPETLAKDIAERVLAEEQARRGQQFNDLAQQASLFPEDTPQPVLGEAVPGQPDFFATKQVEQRVVDTAAQQIVENHPIVKAAEKAVDKAVEVLDALKKAGADAAAIQKAQKDYGLAKAKAEAARKNIEKGTKKSRPRSMAHKKQGGGATTDFLTGGLIGAVQDAVKKWSAKKPETTVGENQRAPMKNIPGINEKLKDFVPEQRPMDEIRAELKTGTDVDQNFVQRMVNQLTAGGLYQSLKTNNLLIKKTFESISNAYDRAQKLNRTFIQKDLVPAMRELNLKEKGEIWAKMLLHEGKETLTPDMLRRDGFNEKQIKMYEAYRQAADYALQSINEARAAAGKKPIDPRLGYVAGVFSGDFRRVLYSTVDGQKKVVGVVGSHTRQGLDKILKQVAEKHPEWTVGEEKYMGGTGRSLGDRQKAFEEALEFLGENDPNVRSLVETYHETMTRDAYNYLNQKKHTKQKKGVAGSEGMKEWQTIEKNALEGMKAQIRYLENSYKWAELSKASKELQPMLSDPEINMPNAKRWANQYIDRALGISDNEFSKAMDKIMDGIGKSTGIGPTVFSEGAKAAKNITSKTLLGFANLGFLATNLVQPIVGNPAMAALLRSRGVDSSFAVGAAKATGMMFDRVMGREAKGFNKEALDFADAHGILSSEIFDHSNTIQKGVGYYTNKIAEFGIGQVEEMTRASTFFSLAHTLKDAGMKVEHGLFETAQKMTNMVMTDYRMIETPQIYSSIGPVGHMAANLMRFKHNQLSAMSFYARELSRNKSTRPIAVALAANVAGAGLLGMIGFQEADAVYQVITSKMGKPDTLTDLVLRNSNDLFAHGVFSAATGIDWSNRLGLQDVIPNSIGEAAFPGGGRLVDAAAAVPGLFGTDADRMRSARELVPNSARGLIDRAFFEDEQGRAISPKTLQPTVERSTTDKVAKTFGMTGVHESDQKSKLYQQRLIDKQYTEIRKKSLQKVMDDLYTSGEINQEAVQKYLDAEGDPQTLTTAIEKYQTGRQMTEYERKLVSTAGANSVNAARRLKRLQEAGIE